MDDFGHSCKHILNTSHKLLLLIILIMQLSLIFLPYISYPSHLNHIFHLQSILYFIILLISYYIYSVVMKSRITSPSTSPIHSYLSIRQHSIMIANTPLSPLHVDVPRWSVLPSNNLSSILCAYDN